MAIPANTSTQNWPPDFKLQTRSKRFLLPESPPSVSSVSHERHTRTVKLGGHWLFIWRRLIEKGVDGPVVAWHLPGGSE